MKRVQFRVVHVEQKIYFQKNMNLNKLNTFAMSCHVVLKKVWRGWFHQIYLYLPRKKMHLSSFSKPEYQHILQFGEPSAITWKKQQIRWKSYQKICFSQIGGDFSSLPFSLKIQYILQYGGPSAFTSAPPQYITSVTLSSLHHVLKSFTQASRVG